MVPSYSGKLRYSGASADCFVHHFMGCCQLTTLKRSSSKPHSKHQQTQIMTVHIHWREPVSWTLEHLNSRRLPASGFDSKHLPTLWLRSLSAHYQWKWFLHFKGLKMAHFKSKHVAAQLDTYTTCLIKIVAFRLILLYLLIPERALLVCI